MSPELTKIAQLLNMLANIRQAYVFGSLAKGTARSDSDLDIAIMATSTLDTETRIHLIEQLAQLTGRPIDLIDLRNTGEPLLGEILRHGVLLKGSDSEHAALITRHIFDSEDFLPYAERILKERRQQWIN